ncbi:hypothetical protein KEM52_001679 [Ascosphaera acerosa]|nr:hypothetical protein KEM52_001679 [Ascosphaera acerosa]
MTYTGSPAKSLRRMSNSRKSLPFVGRRTNLDILLKSGPSRLAPGAAATGNAGGTCSRDGDGDDAVDAEEDRAGSRCTNDGRSRSSVRNEDRTGDRAKLDAALAELRQIILTTGIEADSDGMSVNRIYVWLILLNVPPLPMDDYLKLIHRGRSPAYMKIRDDTFRTLATDPLFKRRVTEASLVRLLNATAWTIEDSKQHEAIGGEQDADGARSPDEDGMGDMADLDGEDTSQSNDEVQQQRQRQQQRRRHRQSRDTVAYPGAGGPGTVPNSSDPAIYVQGMNVLAAPLLYTARSEVEAFALFRYLITQECPGYIRGAMDGVHRGLKLMDRCLEVIDPQLAAHLFSKGMTAELYALPSIVTMCACTPPLPEVLHLWDFLFAFGPHLNVLCVVAQVLRMRDILLASERLLRPFTSLNARQVIKKTTEIVRSVPDSLYAELVSHAK